MSARVLVRTVRRRLNATTAGLTGNGALRRPTTVGLGEMRTPVRVVTLRKPGLDLRYHSLALERLDDISDIVDVFILAKKRAFDVVDVRLVSAGTHRNLVD